MTTDWISIMMPGIIQGIQGLWEVCWAIALTFKPQIIAAIALMFVCGLINRGVGHTVYDGYRMTGWSHRAAKRKAKRAADFVDAVSAASDLHSMLKK